MFTTPIRPTSAKRRLFMTPMSAKRPRFTAGRVASVRKINRYSTRGPKRTGTLTAQVKSLQRIVKNLVPEQKYVDVSVSAAQIPANTGTVVHLTAVAQGDTQATRTGNVINVTSVSILGQWTRASDTAVNPNGLYQVALVVDKEQTSDTSPTGDTIFQAANPLSAFPQLNHLERFRIIWMSQIFDATKLVTDSDEVVGATSKVPTQTNFYKKFWTGNIKVAYNGSASTDIEKNGIYIVYLSSDGNNTMDGAATARIGFTDV